MGEEGGAGLHLQHQITPSEAIARFPVYLDTADNDELRDGSKVAITAVITAAFRALQLAIASITRLLSVCN